MLSFEEFIISLEDENRDLDTYNSLKMMAEGEGNPSPREKEKAQKSLGAYREKFKKKYGRYPEESKPRSFWDDITSAFKEREKYSDTEWEEKQSREHNERPCSVKLKDLETGKVYEHMSAERMAKVMEKDLKKIFEHNLLKYDVQRTREVIQRYEENMRILSAAWLHLPEEERKAFSELKLSSQRDERELNRLLEIYVLVEQLKEADERLKNIRERAETYEQDRKKYQNLYKKTLDEMNQYVREIIQLKDKNRWSEYDLGQAQREAVLWKKRFREAMWAGVGMFGIEIAATVGLWWLDKKENEKRKRKYSSRRNDSSNR